MAELIENRSQQQPTFLENISGKFRRFTRREKPNTPVQMPIDAIVNEKSLRDLKRVKTSMDAKHVIAKLYSGEQGSAERINTRQNASNGKSIAYVDQDSGKTCEVAIVNLSDDREAEKYAVVQTRSGAGSNPSAYILRFVPQSAGDPQIRNKNLSVDGINLEIVKMSGEGSQQTISAAQASGVSVQTLFLKRTFSTEDPDPNRCSPEQLEELATVYRALNYAIDLP